jgi:hypothetical protein
MLYCKKGKRLLLFFLQYKICFYGDRMKRYYKIAGLIVEMDSFGKTVLQAEPYAVPDQTKSDVQIENCPEEFRNKYSETSEDSCEYIYSGASFYKQLINFDGIMIHSSAVVVDGVAYLFTAPSGTGKSTHTSLYIKEFGDDRAFILNDDKPAIRYENGGFFAYGTPWSGKTNMNKNVRVPVGGICILSRGEKNEISRTYGKDAFLGIYSQTLRPRSEKYMEKVLFLIEKMIEILPIWSLKCNMEPEAAHISYSAMSNP